MTIKIKSEVINIADLDPAIDRYQSRMKRVIKKWLNAVGLLVRSTAQASILRGSKTGRIYEKYGPRRTHQASAAGEAPASDTGTLARSIDMDINEQELSVDVGTNVFYAKWLELGSSIAKARPFLLPALDKHKARFVAMLRAILREET